LISELGLGSAEDVVSVTPLTGGVSSDIALVDMGTRKICVKFALKQLKVAEEWYAKVERNRAEYRWLTFAASIVPEATPTLLGASDTANGFAMEFVEGDDVYLWKTELLRGQNDRGEAARVGQVLGKIQAASSSEEVLAGFQNQEDFYALRLEPYLVFTATRHPAVSDKITGLVDMLNQHQLVLVHGDVSPKNIIFRGGGPIFLDAECATIGDPSFDLSFCLNHLILKAVHIENNRSSLLASVLQFWTAYAPHVTWESAGELEKRVCRLLPAMLLARVDGKSPVEYLDADEQATVRSVSLALIRDPADSLAVFVERITLNLENKS
jgi:aminoglycoside phosphotransferase (APT) family kinase protein